MSRSMRCLAGLVLLAGLPLGADDGTEVETLTRETVNKVLGILQDKGQSKDAKRLSVLGAIGNILDYDQMAKLAFRRYWARLEKEQREEFSSSSRRRRRRRGRRGSGRSG